MGTVHVYQKKKKKQEEEIVCRWSGNQDKFSRYFSEPLQIFKHGGFFLLEVQNLNCLGIHIALLKSIKTQLLRMAYKYNLGLFLYEIHFFK